MDLNCILYTLKGNFIHATATQVSEEDAYRTAGWWAFQGFELERLCLRTRNDDNDLRLMIARERGRVVAVLSMVRPGARELGFC